MATDLTSLSATIVAKISGSAQKAFDLGTSKAGFACELTKSLSFGTEAGQINQVWGDRRVLAKATAENIDLAGVLTNALGATATFAKIKGIIVRNRSDEADLHADHTAVTDAQLVVGGTPEAPNEAKGFQGPSHEAGDAEDVEAGNVFLITNFGAGWAITADDADLFPIENTDADDQALYEIILLGVSA